MYSFNVSGANNSDLSNLVLFRNTAKVISEVDFVVNTGISNYSVRLNLLK